MSEDIKEAKNAKLCLLIATKGRWGVKVILTMSKLELLVLPRGFPKWGKGNYIVGG